MIAKYNITVNENKKNLKQKKQDYNELIKLGIRDVHKKNFEGAVKNFLNAININSKKYQAFINLSNVYILQNKTKKGIEVLKKYLTTNNYQTNIVNHLGMICIKHNYENDLKELFKYLSLDLNSHNNKKYFFYIICMENFCKKKMK